MDIIWFVYEKWIEKYKRRRTYRHLSRSYSGEYVFVGVGQHSLHNLYPVLDYLSVPLKYVVASSKKTVAVLQQASGRFTTLYDPEPVWSDEQIRGVFICTSPASHYDLCSQALRHGKQVFVEKPPYANSAELEQLIALEREMGGEVLTGMQRRYAPACGILKRRLDRSQHYVYRYDTGGYPEGEDVLTELFIHPLDLVVFLFGRAELVSLLQTEDTLLLQLRHTDGVIGSVELSTGYAWQMAAEQMTVVQPDGILELNGLAELLYRQKPRRVGSIPLEKVMCFNPVTEVLFHSNGFQPVMEHNSLYVNGFYSEIETFVSVYEQKAGGLNRSGLSGLRPVYALIEEIRRRTSSVV